jgi:putative tricarboxylic transport membrane protein
VQAHDRGSSIKDKITMRTMTPTREEFKDSIRPMLRGSAVGSFFGALPGTGGSIASFMAYAVENKVAKDPNRFGTGAIESVTAPESANNAGAQTAFALTLTLGIPSDATMALMLGALMIHGIQPGPMMMSEQPEIFWGLIVSFGVGNFLLLSRGDMMTFVERPISASVMAVTALLLIWTVWNAIRTESKVRAERKILLK